jgi:hypothetical protein
MILSKETHRPSSVKLWQIPQPAAEPIPFCLLSLETPLDAHDTSYFAASANVFNLSNTPGFMGQTYMKIFKNTMERRF